MTKFKKLIDNFQKTDFLISAEEREELRKKRLHRLNAAIKAVKLMAKVRDENNNVINVKMTEIAGKMHVALDTLKSYLNILVREGMIVKIGEDAQKRRSYKITASGLDAANVFSQRGDYNRTIGATNNKRFYNFIKELTEKEGEAVAISKSQLAKNLSLTNATLVRIQNTLVDAGKIEAITQQGCITKYRVLQ